MTNNMNRTFKTLVALLLTALCFVQCSQTDNKSLRIKGKLEGVKDTLVFSIMAIENGEPVAHDTIISTKGGEFDFTMHLDSAAVMTVSDMANDKYDMLAGFYSVAVPGEEMVIEGDINKGWRYSGSKFYRELNEVEQAVQPINLEIRDFTAEWNKLEAAGDSARAPSNARAFSWRASLFGFLAALVLSGSWGGRTGAGAAPLRIPPNCVVTRTTRTYELP